MGAVRQAGLRTLASRIPSPYKGAVKEKRGREKERTDATSRDALGSGT